MLYRRTVAVPNQFGLEIASKNTTVGPFPCKLDIPQEDEDRKPREHPIPGNATEKNIFWGAQHPIPTNHPYEWGTQIKGPLRDGAFF